MGEATWRKGTLALALLVAVASVAAAVDYSGATWAPACSCNYTTDDRPSTDPVDYIVIHVAEGSYQNTINWFQDPNAKSSAHYVVAQDGRVAQMVLEKDIAWHAGNWEYNKHSVGIEHEGYTSDAATWTEAMYRASAALTRSVADRYGIALVHPTGIMPASATTQTGIIGHDQVPDPNDPSLGGGINHHTDPGAYFDWTHFMDLVRGAAPAPFNVSIVSPTNGAWVHGNVTIQGKSNEEGRLQWMRILVDGQVAKWVTASPHAWSWDTTGVTEGAHTIQVQAQDTSGATAIAKLSVRLDNTLPTVTITSPRDGTLNVGASARPDPTGLTIATGNVPIRANATDALSGVSSVVFSIDGTPRATIHAAPFAWTWPAGGELPGPHTITVTAIDQAGNVASADRAIDLTVPS